MVPAMRTKVLVFVVAAGLLGAAGCSSDGDSPAAQSSESFCTFLVAFRAANESLSGDLNSGNSAQASSAMRRIVGQAELLQQRAPADIKPDVDTAATFIKQLDALLARFDYDIAKVEADPAAVDEFAALNSDEVTAALDQLRAYGDVECVGTVATTTA
jgi:hypothetical protein